MYTDEEMRRKAYHEAGHAVVAFALGVPVLNVAIVPALTLVELGSDSVHVQSGRMVMKQAGVDRFTDALITAGGPAGEAWGIGVFDEQSAVSDLQALNLYALQELRANPSMAREAIDLPSRAEADAAIDRVVDKRVVSIIGEARELLAKNEAGLAAVAQSLVKRQEIFRSYFELLCRRGAEDAG